MAMGHFWLVYFIFVSVLGFGGLAVTYYWPKPNAIWTHRFRTIRGEDHVGFILEATFLFLVLLVLACFVTNLFEEQATALYPNAFSDWWFWLIIGAVLVLVLYQCFVKSPEDFQVKIKGNKEKYPALAEYFDDQHWQPLFKGAVRRYIPYSFYSFLTIATLAIIIVLIAMGIVHDAVDLRQAKAYLHQAMAAISGPPADATGMETVKRPIIDRQILFDFERLLFSYSYFEDKLLTAIVRYVGVIGFFMLLLWWFVGTSFQEVYVDAAQNKMRYANLAVILFFLPGLLLLGYGILMSSYNEVHASFFQAIKEIAATDNASPGSGGLAFLTPENAPELSAFNDLKARFIEQTSVQAFWIRIAESWGGVIIILSLFLPFIQSKLTQSSLYSNLFPSGGSKFRAIFAKKSEETDDRQNGVGQTGKLT